MPDRDDTLCWAGRKAFFGGQWDKIPPCPNEGNNVIGHAAGEPMRLCDWHFREVNNAGLVDEVNIGRPEFNRRERRRRAREGRN